MRAPALLTTPRQELREATGTWHQQQGTACTSLAHPGHLPSAPGVAPAPQSRSGEEDPRQSRWAMGYQHGICQPTVSLGTWGRAARRGRAAGAIPRQGQHPKIGSMDLTQPCSPGDTAPPSLPKTLPIWEVTDPFTANGGKCQPGSGKRGQEEGAVCAASSEISASPRGEAASLPSSWLTHCRCPREPPRRNKPMAATERRQTQPGRCSRHLQRSGISPSLWCLLVASLTSCRGCAEASEHSSPTHLAREPCQELKGNGPSVTQPRRGDRARGP